MNSIVGAIHELYEQNPRRRKPPTGWPTGSRLGTCCAQLQFLRFPEMSKPEPFQPRALRVFENGDRIEAWLAEKLKEVYPGLVGFQQEPFFFPVSLTDEERRVLVTKIESRAIWGRVMDHFNPPKLYLGDDGRVKARLVPRTDQGRPINYGFVIDLHTGSLFVPTYIDFAVKHPALGLCVVECKSMSNFAFRRAVLGHLDLGKSCQLVGFGRATGANVVMVAYRSETAHLLELAYTRSADKTRVILTAPNGTQEVFFVDAKAEEKAPLSPQAGGEPQGLPADMLWDTAETWTPYDASLEADIDRRVLDVLLFDGDRTRVKREYGPSFACATCEGTGQQSKAKTTGELLKKGPKTCEDCGATGLLERVELPAFPCGYCAVATSACWSPAGVERTIDTKPHLWLTRAGFEASGIAVYPVDGGAEE